MLGSKIIIDVFLRCKTYIISGYDFIRRISSKSREAAASIKFCILDFIGKWRDLENTNFNLGVFHLHQGNLGDAILRFHIALKLSNYNNQLASYWLGWCYVLKNNKDKAIVFLNKCNIAELHSLRSLLQDSNSCEFIPDTVWRTYRDITASHYTRKFYDNKTHLPYSFVYAILRHCHVSANVVSILELSCNVGLIGYEIRKRFSEPFKLIGIESAQSMIDLIDVYYQNMTIYDQVIVDYTNNFLNNSEEKFDLIVSFCGLCYTSNLQQPLKSIYNKLNDNGYCAFCIQVIDGDSTHLVIKSMEFLFSKMQVINDINNSPLQLLETIELSLLDEGKYLIVLCKK